MKVVINKCFGGFGLSNEATVWLIEHGVGYESMKVDELSQKHRREFVAHSKEGERIDYSNCWHSYGNNNYIFTSEDEEEYVVACYGLKLRDEDTGLDNRDEYRVNPLLVQCVEELGEKANGLHSSLKIVEIPDGVDWYIDDYDGMESIHESHRSWE